jgi:SAM-dependent methyltransferase
MEHLYALESDQHWIDAGAGEALAVRDYLAADAPTQKARVTAVSITRPQSASLAEIERRFAASGFRYLAGKPIEERAIADLGLADLISDVYGPLQYARQIDSVVEAYARLLKTGGLLFAVLPAITFLKKDGKEMELTDWLWSIRGFRPRRIPDPGSHMYQREVILERNGETIFVPPIRLIRVTEGPPPLREYEQLSASSDS